MGWLRSQLIVQNPERLQAAGRRVDRSTDSARAGGIGIAQADEQVVELHDRMTGSAADNFPLIVQFPTFRRTSEHDVALLRINEDILHASQSSQISNLIRQWLASRDRICDCFLKSLQ